MTLAWFVAEAAGGAPRVAGSLSWLSRRFLGQGGQVVGHDFDHFPVLPQDERLIVPPRKLGGGPRRADHGLAGAGNVAILSGFGRHSFAPLLTITGGH